MVRASKLISVANELKKKNLVILLTTRRLIRVNCGHLILIQSGALISFITAVLKNAVTAIFMVVYYLQQRPTFVVHCM